LANFTRRGEAGQTSRPAFWHHRLLHDVVAGLDPAIRRYDELFRKHCIRDRLRLSRQSASIALLLK
jgi:hypothetical protein